MEPASTKPVALIPWTWAIPTGKRPELLVFAAALALFNLPLLQGEVFTAMVLAPAAVAAGEWWRLITHPFVHVSWYHLLLDGVAFFLLYHDLAEPRRAARLGSVAAAGAGSLFVAWGTSGAVVAHGLCGLSGIAHGLMAITALEMIAAGRTRSDRGWGVVAFVLVIGKSAWEAISGQAFLGWLHFGLMGSPIAVSHAGGVLGGLLAWYLLPRTIVVGADVSER